MKNIESLAKPSVLSQPVYEPGKPIEHVARELGLDPAGIIKLGFPTFAHGSYAKDQGPRGEAADFRLTVHIGKVVIHPGDLVFGDRDGVLIVPREAEEEALSRAFEKLEGENTVRIAIENGMSTVEAFKKYGVM